MKNTLNKSVTQLFYKNENGYTEIKKRWKSAPKYTTNFAQHIVYAVLRGKNWQRAFTPITNTVKLNNGQGAKQQLDYLTTTMFIRAYDRNAERWIFTFQPDIQALFGDLLVDDVDTMIAKLLIRDGESVIKSNEFAYDETVLTMAA